MPGSRTHALASMGNYIFNTDVLLAHGVEAHARDPARPTSASTSCRAW